MPAVVTVQFWNGPAVLAILEERIVKAVNDVALGAYDRAREDAPVRKVFRYGRTKEGLRIQGRQDTRLLSLEEALSESVTRRRLGLPSAFPTDAAGRRLRNSQPLVRTAQISETYRSRDRANPTPRRPKPPKRESNEDVLTRRQYRQFGNEMGLTSHLEEFFTEGGTSLGHRPVRDTEAESDLSVRGRYELKHARKRTPGGTLGGALRRSIQLHDASPGRVMTARITAGNKEVDYAKYVEFGTRRSRAQPFMRPAKAEAREQFLRVLRDAILARR